MYALDLICSNGHKFESWFKGRGTYEEQLAGGMIACPHCGDKSVKQALSPVRIGRHKDAPVAPKAKAGPSPMTKFLEYVEKQFEDVGKKFPEEALRIHLGETEKRGIRGTATPDEERELKEEGVPFFKIPEVQ
jgi:hypothetical protein